MSSLLHIVPLSNEMKSKSTAGLHYMHNVDSALVKKTYTRHHPFICAIYGILSHLSAQLYQNTMGLVMY